MQRYSVDFPGCSGSKLFFSLEYLRGNLLICWLVWGVEVSHVEDLALEEVVDAVHRAERPDLLLVVRPCTKRASDFDLLSSEIDICRPLQL